MLNCFTSVAIAFDTEAGQQSGGGPARLGEGHMELEIGWKVLGIGGGTFGRPGALPQ